MVLEDMAIRHLWGIMEVMRALEPGSHRLTP